MSLLIVESCFFCITTAHSGVLEGNGRCSPYSKKDCILVTPDSRTNIYKNAKIDFLPRHDLY